MFPLILLFVRFIITEDISRLCHNKRYTQCITIRLRGLITTEQTDTPDEHEIHVIHGFIVSSRMRFPPQNNVCSDLP